MRIDETAVHKPFNRLRFTLDLEAIAYGNFFELLVRAVPEFRPIFQEDIEIYDEVINHVFMGDFYPFVLEEFGAALSGGPDADRHRDVVTRSLGFLEAALAGGDPDIETLISISFLEGFAPEAQVPRLRGLMGPRLRRELTAYEG